MFAGSMKVLQVHRQTEVNLVIILINLLISNELGNTIGCKELAYLALLLTILASFFAFSVIFFKLIEKKYRYQLEKSLQAKLYLKLKWRNPKEKRF